WGHRAGKDIYNTCEALADHRDVLRVKLINGKVTYVHRKYWRALLTIATAKGLWQMVDLPKDSKELLNIAERDGTVRADVLSKDLQKKIKSPRIAVKILEGRLLALSSSVHTETGAHAKVLESWQHWMQRLRFQLRPMKLDEALAEIQHVVAAQGPGLKEAKLPWT
ncbi:MAG: hypothetical protein WCO71_09200, partial [Pseudomonadota bacterium]